MEILTWLSNWFADNCDGDWEHTYNIKIQTLDNPGWSFTADLTDTDYEGKLYSLKSINGDDDWLDIKSDGNTFRAVGDASKLMFLIAEFRLFIENSS